jgi:peptidoglycan/xylan/chitin deacetylase (PgdA/CDA1 family)
MSHRLLFTLIFFFICRVSAGQQPQFDWPDGKLAALSLSFDDARASQVNEGLPLFARHKAPVTFYVVPGSMEADLGGWRRAAADGHEIGNHSLVHPCTGNFTWSRDRALEDYTLERMKAELLEANHRIEELVGVAPRTFAYPCGQKFVGRGRGTRSYVPLIAELFTSGRGWLDETPNDPAFSDLAQITGVPMDELDFEQIRPLLETARSEGRWLVLAGHDIGSTGRQTTRAEMLEELLEYAMEPANGIWLAPVGTVTEYVRQQRAE